MINHKLLLNVAVATASLLCADAAQARLMYRIKDLGTLGGANSNGYGNDSKGLAINAAGNVVGQTNFESGNPSLHAFMTNDTGAMIDLKTLGGTTSYGYGINAAGQVVGSAQVSDQAGGSYHAFITDSNGKLIDLDTLGNNTNNATHSQTAYGINAAGKVAGAGAAFFASAINNNHAFITDANGTMIDLGTLAPDDSGSSTGFAINDSGQVAGVANTSQSGQYHAFITESNGQNMADLGTLGGTNSSGRAINVHGQVVGSAQTTGGQKHAFVTDINRNMTDLGTMGGSESEAMAINDNGIIVGKYSLNGDRAFVTDTAGQMTDLTAKLIIDDTTPNWNLSSANGINNTGQITGEGMHDGIIRAFLLTPEEVSPALIAAAKNHGDKLTLNESQKDTVKCDQTKHCSQSTSGSYTLTLKLSADTLNNNLVDIGKLKTITPFALDIGSFIFTGTLASADTDKKSKHPTSLPASWTTSHSLCIKYAHDGISCEKTKTVVDGTVKIVTDKKHGLTVGITGKKSVVDGTGMVQQIYASLC